ncbi:MAG: hypothetical protein HC788_08335 [Sphingopyxis sp.]|nr:hypothetical protein [Sphingopyxis sp.]
MPGDVTIRLWDWPVRLIHWAMVVLIPAMWWTAENDYLEQHRMLGLILLTLVLFRLIWGFAGSSTSRFSSFVRGPFTVLGYALDLVRGRSANYLGHNPLGTGSDVDLCAVLDISADAVGQIYSIFRYYVSVITNARLWQYQSVG